MYVPVPTLSKIIYIYIYRERERERERLPLWLSWLRICLQCKRPGFDLWIGKIPWRREQLPTPVFWPGGFHGLSSPWGHKESDMPERLSLFCF